MPASEKRPQSGARFVKEFFSCTHIVGADIIRPQKRIS